MSPVLAIKCPAFAWSTSLPPSVLRRVPAGASSPFFRRGAESRRTPSNSKRTRAGSNPFLELATTNTRRRRWAKPKNWASMVRHATARRGPYTQPASVHLPPAGCSSQPEPVSAPKKQPNALSLEEKIPGTFSHTTMHPSFPAADRTSSIASAISTKVMVRFPRVSASPSRRPATLNAWQGVPPVNSSGADTSPERMRPGSAVMSPRFGACLIRCSRTADANGSISESHAARHPSGAQATDAASMPLHTEPNSKAIMPAPRRIR